MQEPQSTSSVPMSVLTDKLIRVLDRALDSLSPDELLMDRQALRNLTGALKDLHELQLPDTADQTDARAALTVSFEGETAQMSE